MLEHSLIIKLNEETAKYWQILEIWQEYKRGPFKSKYSKGILKKNKKFTIKKWKDKRVFDTEAKREITRDISDKTH